MANLGFNIRWADNTAQLKKNLAEGLDQIETTRAAVDKIAKSLGGENLIRAAHNYAAALQKIGGEAGALSAIEKLTSQERTRSIALLEKAIQKYQVLGKEAPQALRDILTETKRVATANGELDKPLSGADKIIGSLKTNLGGLASAVGIGFSVGAVVNFGKSLLDDADHLVKLSDKTGVSIQWLQRFQIAADDAGNTLDDITGAITKMSDRLVSGDQSAVGALGKLHLTLDDLAGLTPEDQFIKIADALRQIQSPQEQVNIAMDLFGKSGAEILPTIKRGFDDVKNAAGGMSDATARALDKMGDDWDAWLRWFKGRSAEIVVVLTDEIPKAWEIMSGSFASNRLKEAAIEAAELNAQLKTMAGLIRPRTLPQPADLQVWKPEVVDRRLREIEEQSRDAQRRREQARAALLRHYDAVDEIETRQANERDRLFAESEKREQNYYAAVTSFQENFTKSELAAMNARFALRSKLHAIEGGSLDTIAGRLGKAQSVEVEQLKIHVRGLGDALKSLKSGDFGAVFKDIGGFFKGGIGKIGTGFLEGIGNMALGGLTSLLNAGLGAIGKGVKKLWDGITDAVGRRTNDLRDKFQASFGKNGVGGSLDDLVRGFVKVGLSIEDVNRLLHAGTEKELQRVIDTFNKATATQRTAFDKLNGIVAKYGFTLEDLGPAFRRAKLDEQAQTFYEEFEFLKSQGTDVNTILRLMSGSIKEVGEDGVTHFKAADDRLIKFFQNAKKFGYEIPLAMKPMLQGLIDMGELFDENGNKVTDLEGAGVTFSSTMSQGFRDVVDAIGGLTTAIRDGLGIALSDAEIAARNLKTALDNIPNTPGFEPGTPNYDFAAAIIRERQRREWLAKHPNEPFPGDAIPMAAGGAGMVTRPTLFLAGEAGPEYVSFTPQAMVSPSNMRGGSGGGGGRVEVRQPAVFHVVVDGNVLTSVVVDDVLKDKRGAGTKMRRAMKGAA